MTVVYKIDPLQDPRWSALVERHPQASVFHSRGWLEALFRTYGYRPVVFTTSSPTSELKNGIVFCRVRSWLTGRRMVSLPFSDHCEPLFDCAEDFRFLMTYLQADLERQEWKYLEVRPINSVFRANGEEVGFKPAKQYVLHRVDLHRELGEVFRSLDKHSVQRRIRRAEREGLTEKTGRSEALLRDFYNLSVLTRSRHKVPPQPLSWFRNLVACLGDALEIRVAYKDSTPIAAILTLIFKDKIVYKYGCSNQKFNHLGATSLLLWRTIEQGKAKGATEFDLGRSDEDNQGLITFKEHWARPATTLVYWRFPAPLSLVSQEAWRLRLAKHLFAWMPRSLLKVTGGMIYRHIG